MSLRFLVDAVVCSSVRFFVLLLSSFSVFLSQVALPRHFLIGFRGEGAKYHNGGGGAVGCSVFAPFRAGHLVPPFLCTA